MPAIDPNNDTYSVKGFVSFGATTNNAVDQIAALGELSVRSETYAKDRQIFGGAAGSSPDTSVTVTIFSSRNVSNGSHENVPNPYANTLVEIGRWAYRQAVAGTFTDDPDIFRQQMLAEFADNVTDVTVGPMVQQGTMWLPSYVIFYLTKDSYNYAWPPGTVFDRPRFKLWFSDAAFRSQYDEFQLEFIAPIDTLDDFFLLPSQVRARVESRTLPQLMEKIQAKAGDDPYTILKTITFNYHDPADPNSIYPTNWTFLIYGAAGDNIDAIKSQLAAWILANSTHTREDWVVIFPDIFTSTEFIITPFWTHYAVPNKTLDPGVYSPTVNVNRALEIVRTTSTGTNYTDQHIDDNVAIVGCLYKSIALGIVGGPENIDKVYRFEKKWKDYMAVTTNSPDFSRMQPKTQQFVNMLYGLLKVAEEMTEFSDIPQGMTRLKRTNPQGKQILYVVSSIDNVQYLVVAKNTLEQYFPAQAEPTALALVPADSVTLNTPTGSKRLQINFAATGGVAPYTFSASSPDVVSGTINASTGYLDMVFQDFGTNTLDVTVQDSLGDTFTGTYVVVCPEDSM